MNEWQIGDMPRAWERQQLSPLFWRGREEMNRGISHTKYNDACMGMATYFSSTSEAAVRVQWEMRPPTTDHLKLRGGDGGGGGWTKEGGDYY